jgi:uncharacterized membrane protein
MPDAASASTLVIDRNIRAMLRASSEFDRKKSREQRVADAITGFTGSLPFVYLHIALVAAWILINTGVIPGVRPFDPFPFVMLAMIASVEAIFLSTFVLVSQNRMQRRADRRAELDLQINLLAEHEVTRLLAIVDEIAQKLGVERGDREQLEALKEDVAPEELLDKLDHPSQTETEPEVDAAHARTR